MDVSVDDLKEIVRICVASELQVVYLEAGGVRLALSRGDAPLPFSAAGEGGGRPAGSAAAAPVPEPAVPAASAAPTPAATPAPSAAGPSAAGLSAAGPSAAGLSAAGPSAAGLSAAGPSAAGLFEVRAPLLGVFYRRPTPGEPPFAEVGAEVGEEDTVCLIEVMKMFSRVPAGCRGRVTEICVEDGTMVEYGQTLMQIRPA